MLGTVSILLRGIPFIYQGQEIGMTNCRREDIHDYDDIDTYHQYQVALDAGLSKEEALDACYRFSRDNARTPMQWNAEKNVGFTMGKPWLAVNENYREINVEDQEKDPNSVLNYYKRLIRLRKDSEWKEVFVYGNFLPMYEKDEQIFAYARKAGEKTAVVLANFGEKEMVVELDKKIRKVLLSNQDKMAGIDENKVILKPCEVVVVSI